MEAVGCTFYLAGPVAVLLLLPTVAKEAGGMKAGVLIPLCVIISLILDTADSVLSAASYTRNSNSSIKTPPVGSGFAWPPGNGYHCSSSHL